MPCLARTIVIKFMLAILVPSFGKNVTKQLNAWLYQPTMLVHE
jgi:hypothetical protein